jgi:hypothetical protein
LALICLFSRCFQAGHCDLAKVKRGSVGLDLSHASRMKEWESCMCHHGHGSVAGQSRPWKLPSPSPPLLPPFPSLLPTPRHAAERARFTLCEMKRTLIRESVLAIPILERFPIEPGGLRLISSWLAVLSWSWTPGASMGLLRWNPVPVPMIGAAGGPSTCAIRGCCREEPR